MQKEHSQHKNTYRILEEIRMKLKSHNNHGIDKINYAKI